MDLAVRDWECVEVFVMMSTNYAALVCSASSLVSVAVARGALTVFAYRARRESPGEEPVLFNTGSGVGVYLGRPPGRVERKPFPVEFWVPAVRRFY